MPATTFRLARLAALATTFGLAACTSVGSPPGASSPAGAGSGAARGQGTPTATSTPSTTVDPAVDPAVAAVESARRLAAQYDYTGARRALAGVAGPAVEAERSSVDAVARTAVTWADNGAVPHLFYHSLVVDPARAFHAGQGKAQGYLDYMVTEKEFRAQVQQLHARGHVLVHATDLARPDARGVMRWIPIALPPGKKPLVLSIDDVSYYEYMTGDGFASRLVLDGGTVRTQYTDAQGRTRVGADDVVPIVDDFVQAHPDFSYHGHKGTLALTGYNGVLGYRTSVREYGDTPQTRDQVAQATKVAAAMKDQGWLFASHTWGHLDATKDSVARLTADAHRWDAEVRPVVGPTPQLIFAFGADIGGVRPYSTANPKYRMYRDAGFDYFFPIDASRTAWSQLTAGSLRQARINVDGISMGYALRHPQRSVLRHFFDVASVVDPARPRP